MYQVKLIIANTQTDTVYFNHGDDYSDIVRIFVEDHSPWEEVDDLYELQSFVKEYNRDNKKRRMDFAFLIINDQQISAQEAIATILAKKERLLKKEQNEARIRKEAMEKAAQERTIKKMEKTKAQKRKLLEQLKQEFGEQ